MTDTSGPSSLAPFAHYDPESSCWRTSQHSFLLMEDPSSEKSSVTWPKQGTTRSGRAYGHRTLEPRTVESESSLLPTPTATNMTDVEDLDKWRERRARLRATGVNGNGMGTPLAVAVRLLPTPTARDGKGVGQRTGPGGDSLPTALLPTPNASDGTGGKQHKIGSINATGMKPDGTKVQVSLRDALNLLPTPKTSDGTGGGHMEAAVLTSEQPLALLPTPNTRDRYVPQPGFMEGSLSREVLSIGLSTAQPSADGSASPGQHPSLWTNEGGSTCD